MDVWASLLHLAYGQSAGLAFVICLAIAVPVGLITRVSLATHVQVALLLFGVAALGATTGFAGGMSREPVVGGVLSAVVALVGGVAIYLFGADNSKGGAVSLTAGCFALAIFFSYSSASQFRQLTDQDNDARERCLAVYSNSDILKDSEALGRFEARMAEICATLIGSNYLTPSQGSEAPEMGATTAK